MKRTWPLWDWKTCSSFWGIQTDTMGAEFETLTALALKTGGVLCYSEVKIQTVEESIGWAVNHHWLSTCIRYARPASRSSTKLPVDEPTSHFDALPKSTVCTVGKTGREHMMDVLLSNCYSSLRSIICSTDTRPTLNRILPSCDLGCLVAGPGL